MSSILLMQYFERNFVVIVMSCAVVIHWYIVLVDSGLFSALTFHGGRELDCCTSPINLRRRDFPPAESPIFFHLPHRASPTISTKIRPWFLYSSLTSLLYWRILTGFLFIFIILEIASMTSTGVQGYEVLSYIFGILAIVLNGVLLASMYKERKKIFVTRISFLVANLAFADCLSGLFLIALHQPIKVIEYKSNARLLTELPLIWTAFCASFLTLFLMAAERLVVVTLPMVWSKLLTIPRSLLCIFAVWLLSIGGGVAIHYKRYYAQFFICLIVEISALCFIATHIYIVWLLQRREKHRMVVNKNSSQDSPCLPTPPNENNNHSHRKVTIVVTILLSVLIVTCVPYFVCLQMFTINNTFDKTLSQRVNLEIYDKAMLYSRAVLYVNFFMNPIIYAWRLRMYRKAFYSLVGRSTS